MSKEKIIFDASSYDYLMRNNGCSVGFNMPDALEGENTHGLPPYRKRMPYLVDKYPGCPSDWLKSEGKVKSYFVPVVEGSGMWLDFNYNETNTHHVAIVISIQGVNPITGLPCTDAQLEQYIEKCPKHKIAFGPDRYCKKCDYKWSKQNYICTTGTPQGSLWLDGFKAVDGIVRQYILTAEKMRGVASNVIGKDRVHAIGVSFFLSKEKKPPRQGSGVRLGGDYNNMALNVSPIYNSGITPYWQYISDSTSGDFDAVDGLECVKGVLKGSNSFGAAHGGGTSSQITCSSAAPEGSLKSYKSVKRSKSQAILRKSASPVRVKKLEVGAGAKIRQIVYDDPEKLDYWHDDPESIICVNYCAEIEARKIIEQGTVNIEGHEEGFLKDVPVGN